MARGTERWTQLRARAVQRVSNVTQGNRRWRGRGRDSRCRLEPAVFRKQLLERFLKAQPTACEWGRPRRARWGES
eukprot:1141594-Pleurochrysis_carterae.AAC.3